MRIKFNILYHYHDIPVERAELNPHKLYRVKTEIFTSVNEARMFIEMEESA